MVMDKKSLLYWRASTRWGISQEQRANALACFVLVIPRVNNSTVQFNSPPPLASTLPLSAKHPLLYNFTVD